MNKTDDPQKTIQNQTASELERVFSELAEFIRSFKREMANAENLARARHVTLLAKLDAIGARHTANFNPGINEFDIEKRLERIEMTMASRRNAHNDFGATV